MELRSRLNDNETVIGTFVGSLYTPAALKVMATAGLDFIILDLEHTGMGWGELASAIAYCRAISLPALVRVPNRSRATVGRSLDIGAVGIVFPRVEHADDVHEIAELTLYPPAGNMAAAFGGGHNDFVAPNAIDYIREANERLVNVVQIETVRGMENLAGICTALNETKCANVLEVSRVDLTVSMGIPMAFDDQRYVSAVEEVLAAAEAYGLVAGKGFNSMTDAEKWIKRGVRMGIHSSELQVFRGAWTSAAEELRALVASR